MRMSNNTRAAHTAEHAFIGSLQKILNKTLSVRKVEHKDSHNIAFIKALEVELDSDSIVLAEKENHDLSACSMEHVSNLSDCIFFLVTNMSINGSDYEIRFLVGKSAMDEAVKMTEKINIICKQVGSNYNTVEATIKKLHRERQHYYNQLKKLTNKVLADIPVQHFDNQNIAVVSTILDNMDWRTIQTFVAERILEARTIVILINTDDNDMANLVFARSGDVNLDCPKIFEDLRKDQKIGKGGGKPNFINA